MTRFVRLLLLLLAIAAKPAIAATEPAPVEISLVARADDAPLSSSFIGLSFEMQRLLPDKDGRRYFSPANKPLLSIFHTLGVKSLRIGGNTADRPTVPFPGPEDIDALFSFARAARVKVLFTLRLRQGDPRQAASVAKYITERHADVLEAFAIGNEPNVFASDYAEFLKLWNRFADTVASPEFSPSSKFAGPGSTAGKSFWTRDFARDVGPTGKLAAATQHIYPGGNSDLQKDPAAARDLMLSPDWVAGYQKFHDGFVPDLREVGIPYRFEETNSFWNGGRAGASDTLAAALWALDYQNWWARHGAQGLNFHTGDYVAKEEHNTRSMYSAIWSTETGYEAKPVAYALAAFAQTATGRVGDARIDRNPATLNFTAYLTHDDHAARVTLINKEHGPEARAASALLVLPPRATVETLSLATPDGDIARTTGLELGGAPIAEDGTWSGHWAPADADAQGRLVVNVPPASALIVKLSGSDVRHLADR